MFTERPWLRTALFVFVAAILLAAVGALAYGLGARNAASIIPANAQFDRNGLDGPPGNNRPQGADGQRGERPQSFDRIAVLRRLAGRGLTAPWLGMLRLVIGVALLGAIALGVAAFFRTGGWRRPAVVEAESKPKKK